MITAFNKFKFGRSRKSVSGFTLVELIVVIAIVLILNLLVISQWRSFLNHQRFVHTVNRWLIVLRLARGLALKYHAAVTLFWQPHVVLRYAGKSQQLHFSLHHVTVSFHSSFARNDYLTFTADGATQGQQGSFYLCSLQLPSPCARIVVLHSGVVRHVID